MKYDILFKINSKLSTKRILIPSDGISQIGVQKATTRFTAFFVPEESLLTIQESITKSLILWFD